MPSVKIKKRKRKVKPFFGLSFTPFKEKREFIAKIFHFQQKFKFKKK
jgi:hypothetical protein